MHCFKPPPPTEAPSAEAERNKGRVQAALIFAEDSSAVPEGQRELQSEIDHDEAGLALDRMVDMERFAELGVACAGTGPTPARHRYAHTHTQSG
jgi:hypothetical protein